MKRSLDDFTEPFPIHGKRIKFRGITPVLKRQCWERHIGIGILESPCPMCGIQRIFNNVNTGFEVAHIVSQQFVNEDLTILYAYPSCRSCNNECGDMCVLDYLYCRGRIKQLKKLMMNMYELFLLSHGDELVKEHCMAWKVIDHLYGRTKFPAGGGIQNAKQIYEIARMEQYRKMSKESARLAKKLEKLGEEMSQLMECEIKTMSLMCFWKRMKLIEWSRLIFAELMFYTLEVTNCIYLLDRNFELVKQISSISFTKELQVCALSTH